MLPGCKSKIAGSIPPRGDNNYQLVKKEICGPVVCQLARKSEGLIRQSPSWVAGMAASVEPAGGLLKLGTKSAHVARCVLIYGLGLLSAFADGLNWAVAVVKSVVVK